MQRQITHVLGYVFPQKDVTWRLNWYNEVRMPLLTSAILNDEGESHLHTKMKELHDLVIQNPLSVMEQDDKHADKKSKKKNSKEASEEEPSTAEEKFLDSALHNLKLHAKAKMIVNNMVAKIKQDNEEKKAIAKAKNKPEAQFDTFDEWGNFTALVTKLNEILLDDNPDLARKMGLVPSEQNEMTQFGVGTMG